MYGTRSSSSARGIGAPPAVPTIAEVTAYIRDRWAAFNELGPRFVSLQHRAAIVSAAARSAGDMARAEQSKGLIRSIGELHGQWLVQRARWEGLRSSLGLGAFVIPAAYVAIAVALVAAAAFIFERAGTQERALELLERGKITPAQLAELGLDLGDTPPGGLESLATAVKWAAAGVVAVSALRAFESR